MVESEKDKKITFSALSFAFKNHNNIKNQLLRFTNINLKSRTDQKYSKEKEVLNILI